MPNLFADLPERLTEELFETLLQANGVHIERIVSQGHASPAGFWYDQPRDEWVALLQGAATLRFEAPPRTLELQPGDCVHIPAHERHRVEWTAADPVTIWLAVHFDA